MIPSIAGYCLPTNRIDNQENCQEDDRAANRRIRKECSRFVGAMK
jgi:hypothetical protein